jgi:hypothetical protein
MRRSLGAGARCAYRSHKRARLEVAKGVRREDDCKNSKFSSQPHSGFRKSLAAHGDIISEEIAKLLHRLNGLSHAETTFVPHPIPVA